MDSIPTIFNTILLIFGVILSFNVIIFVHELGHFLAAKWRGLQIDRFQIWFGKPIWKKTIGGVQYGLGWLPAGGFVALPQMAPMESIEGTNTQGKPLPPITPIDKIIVAFAGPLFSFLLAAFAAVLVWQFGTPDRQMTEQRIGYIAPDMPAAQAGFQLGDKITLINGHAVRGFAGNLDAITESIIFSEGDKLDFTIERDGQPVQLQTGFDISEGSFFQRRGVRRIGIAPMRKVIIGGILPNSPAEQTGLKINDEITHINDTKVFSFEHFQSIIKKLPETPVKLTLIRDGNTMTIQTMTLYPSNDFKAHHDAEKPAMLGFVPKGSPIELHHPSPTTQLKDAALMIWLTVKKLTSPKSSIGIDSLGGPIKIAEVQYDILDSNYPIRYLLYFWVLFNVNLAIFNLLPFPVLDGGHIVMATWELISGKPLNTRFLETVQTFFVLILLSFLLYITNKDLFSDRKKPNRDGLPASPTFDLSPLQQLAPKH